MIRPCRILLVEDSRTQAMKLTHVLQGEGWQVDWVATVEAAMQRLNQASPDLIMLDYHLPGIPGDELCRRLRMNLDLRSIPILMLTMDGTHETELRGLESGADDFVPKSVDAEILMARVRTLLSKPAMTLSLAGPADQRFRQARLLTIDDSPTYQEYLAAELEQEGYQVVKSMNAREGLARLREERFDCALVDLIMPEMNGIEFCREVSALRRTTDTALGLLMLTGRENKDDLTRALEAGADDFVGKSSDLAVLKGRIRALLRRKFCQEDNRRIVEELKNKEVELLRARAATELAEARAALNDELERRVQERTAQLAKANLDLAQQTQENELFVYSVSHDLRSPLLNLQGFSSELALVGEELHALLADERIPGEVRQQSGALIDGSMADAVRFIQSGVLRLSRIIDALLRLSRAGRIEYQWQLVDLPRIVQGVVESLANTIAQRGAAVLVHELPPAW
ncbi:MAG TPA: response regulator, partial [Pirellulales bacterium]|nr:response regulator [Pirellulales bacterium]